MSDINESLTRRIAALEAKLEALAARERIGVSSAGALVAGRVVYVDANGNLTTDSLLTYDDTNDVLLANRLRTIEQATPSTPVAGFGDWYFSTASVPSAINDAGTVYETVIRSRNTFTPTYFGQTTAGVTTYTTQAGRYERLDSRVDFSLYVAWSNATGTGNALVGGLPFTVENVSNQLTAPSVWYTNITFAAGGGVQVLIRPNTTQIELWNQPVSNATAAQLTVDTAGELIIAGTFFLATPT